MNREALSEQQQTKYNTFTLEEQHEIISLYHKFKGDDKTSKESSKLTVKEFNKFLKTHIPNYVNFPSFLRLKHQQKNDLKLTDSKVLRNLRRQIEGWLRKQPTEDSRMFVSETII